MKKLLLLLLILPYLAIAQSADATPIENILLTNAIKDNLATRVIVQDSITKELKFVLKSTLNTNISIGNKNENTFQLLSSTGSGPVVPQATTTEAGLLNSNDKTKLNGVATGATANSTDAQLRDRSTHTGTQTASTISDIQSTIQNNTAVLTNTAKVTNANHTGDVTGSNALTLATVNTNIGTFNNVTVNGKGLVTSGSNVTYATGSGSATGTNTGDNAINTQYSGLATSKENTITAGTTSQYFRGDKTFQELNKAAVGLSNAENTSDLNKPISTANQTALNAKNPLISHLEFEDTTKSIWNNGSADISTNTSFGLFAASNKTSGGDEVAIGYNAGKNTFSGNTSNTQSQKSIYIGSGSTASGNNQTNQIVIGYNTIGFGSNSVVLGNTDITKTILRGTVSGENGVGSSDFVTKSQLDTKISGSGSTNQLAIFTASGAVGNSNIIETNNEFNLTKVTRQVAIAQASDQQKDANYSHYTSDFAGYNYHALRYGNGIGGAIGAANESLGDGSGMVGNRRGEGSGHGGEFSRLENGVGDGIRGNQEGTGRGNGVSGIRYGTGIGHGGEFRRLGTGFGYAVYGEGDIYSTSKILAGGGVSEISSWVSSSVIARFGHSNFNTANNFGFLQADDGATFVSGPSFNVFSNSSVFTGTVAALPATLSTELATLGQVRPYKIYVALLTQTGTSAPVATVLENTFGEALTWIRNAAGFYAASIANGFDETKTTLIIGIANSPGTIADFTIFSDATISLNTKSSGIASDGVLLRTTVEIRLYN